MRIVKKLVAFGVLGFLSSGLLQKSYALEISVHDFPPFVQKLPNGEVGGPFRIIIDDICRELSQTCHLSVAPNRRSKLQVEGGEVDAGFPYGWTQKRSQEYHYSVPFMLSEYGLFVSENNEIVVNGINDLQGYQVAAFTPSMTLISLEGLRNDMLIQGLNPLRIFKKTDANGQLVQMLAADRISSYYSNKALVEFRAEQFGVTGIRYAWRHKPVMYFLVFPRAYTDVSLVKKFNQAALKVFAQPNYLQGVLSPWNIEVPDLSEATLKRYKIER
ncbi:transporter substrate-binding domain-containing protein [Vibrio sp. T187]|uniref:substrate-binding periplasmic protein n=1 Tax=Vibrio TaxID=662 RepID=UPI0010C9CD91|nr:MULTISPECIES: transporter substrate-binding domain-containing protein [Vibrio]MBW3695921.1 transporter substrate-binding domain-containing protein [Vibrio sp. T187]